MTQQARGTATKERILDGALSAFAALGHGGVSIEEIAARAPASVGSIYHHFGDRAGVVGALYRRCMTHLLDEVTRAVLPKRSARAGLTTLVRTYLSWMRAHPHEARFIFVAGQVELPTQPLDDVVAWKRALVAPLFSWLAPFIERGEVRRMPMAYYEIVIIGPLAELSARSLGTALDVDEATRVLGASLWRSLSGA